MKLENFLIAVGLKNSRAYVGIVRLRDRLSEKWITQVDRERGWP